MTAVEHAEREVAEARHIVWRDHHLPSIDALIRAVRALVAEEILADVGPQVWGPNSGWVDSRDRDHAARIAREGLIHPDTQEQP